MLRPSTIWPSAPNAHRVRRSVGQFPYQPVDRGGIDLKERHIAGNRLAVIAGKNNLATLLSPAQNPTSAAQIGQPARDATFRRHDVYFGCSLFTPHKRHRLPVERVGRTGHLPQVAGKATSDSPAGIDVPQIVLGDKDDVVTVNGGKAIIARMLSYLMHPLKTSARGTHSSDRYYAPLLKPLNVAQNKFRIQTWLFIIHH